MPATGNGQLSVLALIMGMPIRSLELQPVIMTQQVEQNIGP
jgi:hypothetical protein